MNLHTKSTTRQRKKTRDYKQDAVFFPIQESIKAEKKLAIDFFYIPYNAISTTANRPKRNILSGNFKEISIDIVLHVFTTMSRNPFDVVSAMISSCT